MARTSEALGLNCTSISTEYDLKSRYLDPSVRLEKLWLQPKLSSYNKLLNIFSLFG